MRVDPSPFPRPRRPDWLGPAALIALGVVPALGGAVRLAQMAQGVVTPENARFLAAPLPALVHIVGSTLYAFGGALQFVPRLRRQGGAWHRRAGRALVPCGLAAALSGLWLTLAYPAANHDGAVVFASRLLVGVAMALCLLLGVRSAVRRDLAQHRAWMTRAYALALGAGTQVLTHIPWFLLPDLQGETLRAMCMVSGWGLNVLVAEWWIAARAT